MGIAEEAWGGANYHGVHWDAWGAGGVRRAPALEVNQETVSVQYLECHVEAGESATWRQERVPRGGRRECHVETFE